MSPQSFASSFSSFEEVLAAADQSRYWEMRFELIRHNESLSPAFISSSADTLGLDMTRFGKCMMSEQHDVGILADTADACRIGITGTPSSLIGPSSDGEMAGSLVHGAVPYSTFASRLSAILRQDAK